LLNSKVVSDFLSPVLDQVVHALVLLIENVALMIKAKLDIVKQFAGCGSCITHVQEVWYEHMRNPNLVMIGQWEECV
jgi:hypothetical protein